MSGKSNSFCEHDAVSSLVQDSAEHIGALANRIEALEGLLNHAKAENSQLRRDLKHADRERQSLLSSLNFGNATAAISKLIHQLQHAEEKIVALNTANAALVEQISSNQKFCVDTSKFRKKQKRLMQEVDTLRRQKFTLEMRNLQLENQDKQHVEHASNLKTKLEEKCRVLQVEQMRCKEIETDVAHLSTSLMALTAARRPDTQDIACQVCEDFIKNADFSKMLDSYTETSLNSDEESLQIKQRNTIVLQLNSDDADVPEKCGKVDSREESLTYNSNGDVLL